jgi:UDP:flavonoid glycosyltransferase YjiC (YdhE family)
VKILATSSPRVETPTFSKMPLFGGDQWRNAHRVAQVGAGIAVEGARRALFDHPGPAEIDGLRRAVGRVLDDRRYQRGARAIAATADALAPIEAAVDVLRAVADANGMRRDEARL